MSTHANPCANSKIDIDSSSLEQLIPLHVVPDTLLKKVSKFKTAQGYVSVGGLICALHEARDKNRSKRRMLFVAFGFFVAFVLVNMGLTYCMVNLTKEAHIDKNGLMLQSGTSTPVATASARTTTAIHSEMTVNELSQLNHLLFAFNGTIISANVEGFAKLPCTLGEGMCLVDHVLLIYTPDMTVIYHGSDAAFANVSSRVQNTFAASGIHLVDANSIGATGRHLFGDDAGSKFTKTIGNVGLMLGGAGMVAIAIAGAPVSATILGITLVAGAGTAISGAIMEFF